MANINLTSVQSNAANIRQHLFAGNSIRSILSVNHPIHASGAKFIALDLEGQLADGPMPSDAVILPLSASWDLWGEIRDPGDALALAEFMFPAGGDPNPVDDCARSVFAGLLKLSRSNDELLALLCKPIEKLAALLSDTVGAGAISASDKRGVAAILHGLSGFEFLKSRALRLAADKPKFSLTDWVNDSSDRRMVIFSCVRAELPALRSLLAALVGLAITRIQAASEHAGKFNLLFHGLEPLGGYIPAMSRLVSANRRGNLHLLSTNSVEQLSRAYGTDPDQVMSQSDGGALPS